MPGKDYYQILEVTSGATIADIKASYRRLSKLYHPDTNEGNKVLEEKFKELQEAYAVLSDEQKRRRYDEYFADLDFAEMERIRAAYIRKQQKAYERKMKMQKQQEEDERRMDKMGYIIVGVVMALVGVMIWYTLHLRNISRAREAQMDVMVPAVDSSPSALAPTDSSYNLKMKDHKVYADMGNGIWLELMNTDFDKIVAGAWHGTLADSASHKLRTVVFFADPRNNIYDVDYPSVGCSGTWTLRNVSENTLTYLETIETGKAGCDPAIKITLQEVADNRLLLRFYSDSDKVLATAVLKKELPK